MGRMETFFLKKSSLSYLCMFGKCYRRLSVLYIIIQKATVCSLICVIIHKSKCICIFVDDFLKSEFNRI